MPLFIVAVLFALVAVPASGSGFHGFAGKAGGFSRGMVEREKGAVTKTSHRQIVDTGPCSGTLVGKNVIFTAAHCMNNDGSPQKQTMEFVDGRKREANCIPHPGFSNLKTEAVARARFDLAVCILKSDVTDVEPACMGALLEPGSKALAIGNGLTNTKTPDKATYQGQHSGELTVSKWNVEAENYVSDDAKVGLAPGDSGGFWGYTQNGKLMIAGVHRAGSHVDRDTGKLNKSGLSLAVSLHTPHSLQFLNHVRRTRGVQICGLPKMDPPFAPRPDLLGMIPLLGKGPVQITGFLSKSIAEEAGVRKGDRIRRVNGRLIGDYMGLETALKAAGTGPLFLEVVSPSGAARQVEVGFARTAANICCRCGGVTLPLNPPNVAGRVAFEFCRARCDANESHGLGMCNFASESSLSLTAR